MRPPLPAARTTTGTRGSDETGRLDPADALARMGGIAADYTLRKSRANFSLPLWRRGRGGSPKPISPSPSGEGRVGALSQFPPPPLGEGRVGGPKPISPSPSGGGGGGAPKPISPSPAGGGQGGGPKPISPSPAGGGQGGGPRLGGQVVEVRMPQVGCGLRGKAPA